MTKQPSFIKEHLASWLKDRTHVHGPGSGSLRNGCEHLEGRGVLFCFVFLWNQHVASLYLDLINSSYPLASAPP